MEENINTEENVSLKAFFRLFRANALVVAVCIIAGIVGGLAYFFTAKQHYTITATMGITCKDDSGVNRMSTAYLNTIVDSCRQNCVLEEANRLYSPNGSSVKQILPSNLNVTYDEGRMSYYIYVSYEDESKELATEKLNALVEAVQTVGAELASEVITYSVTITPIGGAPQVANNSNRTVGLIAGIAAGIVLAVIIVFVLYMTDDKVKTKEQLEALTSAKLFAVLGSEAGADLAKTAESDGMRRLADHVMILTESGEKKTVLFTSAVAGERVSETVAALAVKLGEIGKRVLTIDLNFYEDDMHSFLGAENTMGLSEYVEGKATAEDIVSDPGYENVRAIFRGDRSTNPSSVLVSEKFRTLIRQAKDEYDIVLLDGSPVLASSDYLYVAPIADASVLCTAYGKTKRAYVAEAAGELIRSGAVTEGAVFTLYSAKIGRTVGYKGETFYAAYESRK